MTMARLSRWLRRSRRVVATAQLLAFAAALFFQGTVHARESGSPASALRAWFKDPAKDHDLLTCAVCALMRTPARLTDGPRVSLWVSASHTNHDVTNDAAPQRLAETSLFSRAPPAPRA